MWAYLLPLSPVVPVAVGVWTRESRGTNRLKRVPCARLSGYESEGRLFESAWAHSIGAR
jgi:hypothetical protein